MQNILVPVDFSETSHHAALYALKLAEQLHAQKVILYHAYQAPLTVDSPVAAVQLFDEVQLKKDSTAALQRFRSKLEGACASGCFLETYNGRGSNFGKINWQQYGICSTPLKSSCDYCS